MLLQLCLHFTIQGRDAQMDITIGVLYLRFRGRPSLSADRGFAPTAEDMWQGTDFVPRSHALMF